MKQLCLQAAWVGGPQAPAPEDDQLLEEIKQELETLEERYQRQTVDLVVSARPTGHKRACMQLSSTLVPASCWPRLAA